MTKRFKAVKNDSTDYGYWEVWDEKYKTLWAKFYGEKCCQYARDHARRLNGPSHADAWRKSAGK